MPELLWGNLAAVVRGSGPSTEARFGSDLVVPRLVL